MTTWSNDTVFRHTPAIRHITAATVDRYGPWARVLFDQYVSAERERGRWEAAAFAAAEAAGQDRLDASPDPDAKRTYAALRRCRKATTRLSMCLALEVAGRLDGERLGDEIVKCITTENGNMPETIIRRLFKVKHIEWLDYDWRKFVERMMGRMLKKKRLGESWGWGRQQTKYFVITPKYLEQKRQEREDRILQEAEQKAQEARQEAVLKVLESRGYTSARSARYGHDEVVLSVEHVEQLLGIVG